MQVTQSTAPLVQAQRNYFQSGVTHAYGFRQTQLKALGAAIQEQQGAIQQALAQDLGKSVFEAVLTETTNSISEINHTLKHLKAWMAPQRVRTSVVQFPAQGEIWSEPLGVVLNISPWNYPFQLAMGPLIGAIAAGNCTILKPSELAPHTSGVIAELIAKTFPPEYITVVEGDKTITQDLLKNRFDHIFFTGSTAIGRLIMAAAAPHLTPVTLELGGKSPCIVGPDAPVELTARRIAWGKFINGGQTCIAPDYVLVPPALKAPLLGQLRHWIGEFYGKNPADSPDYGRIINEHHWQRLRDLVDPAQVVIGGDGDIEARYFAPTVLDGVGWDDPVMEAEIFGPILPILTYGEMGEAIAAINARPKPLALYLFTNDPNLQNQVLSQTSSGGVCINDTIMQLGAPSMPFGGVGESGMGAYHGKFSFDTFSHRKSVLKRKFWLDLDLRYPPYHDKLKWLKWLP
ncbi:aldehyde dehydrogenase [Spirulina sp. CCNP1310]|uniref:aldehyde dehydrogenase n=1 Tax=Spirulina sp. CCNP1310 TaxID=3110249 RepID=UPI002B1EE608|nr:aldehyde dehydrogenase [Spirulina sp. CCNP1310]MEA5418242.1 aldehyde dehydrogenase [Spirulina sp. CCNP1310]